MTMRQVIAGRAPRGLWAQARLWIGLWIGLGAVLLTALYLWRYVTFVARPGNLPAYPEGWWGWFDQSKYIESARALAALDFSAVHHWYPLGYAVLGAPFTLVSAMHPYVVVDLACLLATYAGFLAFARRLGVRAPWGVIVFLGSVATSRSLFVQWVIPWNTTPTSALIWLLLACVVAHMQGVRRPVWIGVLAACVPLFRPTEAPLAALCVAASVLPGIWRRPRDLVLAVLGAALPIAAYALLHAAIYGLAPTPYMLISHDIGFTLHDLGWKAYVILVDPRAWFWDGEGLLRRAPFMALALGGLVVAGVHGRAAGLLAVLLVVHAVLYLSYVDLLPTGLWRYSNVHYWQWALPGDGLLAFLLVRDLLRWRRAVAFPLAPVAFVCSLPILCLQVVPREVGAQTPAKMLAYSGNPPEYAQTYFGPLVMQDQGGRMAGIADFRAIPVPFGLRVYALRRDFAADPVWITPPPTWHGATPPRRYAETVRIGLPCWIRGVHCTKVANDQLPPIE